MNKYSLWCVYVYKSIKNKLEKTHMWSGYASRIPDVGL